MKKGLAVLSGIAAAGAAVGSSFLYFKKNNICPRCEVKKALAKTNAKIALLDLNEDAAKANAEEIVLREVVYQ